MLLRRTPRHATISKRRDRHDAEGRSGGGNVPAASSGSDLSRSTPWEPSQHELPDQTLPTAPSVWLGGGEEVVAFAAC